MGRAAAVREQIAAIDDDKQESNSQILGFLRNEVGSRRSARRSRRSKTFEAAIDIDKRTAPAYLNLGDAHERMGQPPRRWRPGKTRAEGAGARLSRARSPGAAYQKRARPIGSPRSVNASSIRIRRIGGPDSYCHGIWLPLAVIAGVRPLGGGSPQSARPGHSPGSMASAARARPRPGPGPARTWSSREARSSIWIACLHEFPVSKH